MLPKLKFQPSYLVFSTNFRISSCYLALITSENGNIAADKENEDKIKRKVMFLLDQVEVLDKLDGGTSVGAIRRN